jgi:replication factor C small subunit
MVEQLHTTGNDAGFPHLMFAGPAGTGKTATAVALLRSMFGDDWRANFIEMNASDERSINVIRTKVKEFARRGVVGTYLAGGNVRPIPFNVVFLDECDQLTPDAQGALRRIMEQYSKQTRFILSCNYPHRLIDPIKDRCAFSDTRFRPIPSSVVFSALENVVKNEGLTITDEAVKKIGELCRGSMRKALNILFAATRVPDTATIDDVKDVVSELEPKARTRLLASVLKANTTDDDEEYRNLYRRIDRMVEEMGERGFSGADVLDSIYRAASNDDNMPITLKRAIFKGVGEALYHASVTQDDLLTVKTFLRSLEV